MNRFTHSAAWLVLLTANAMPALAQTSGIEIKSLDPSVRIQDDFYAHVNGNWLKKVVIPADKSRWGTFDELRNVANANTRILIEEAIQNQRKPGSEAAKIADIYSSYMDEKKREALGFTPIRAELAKIAGLKDKGQLPALVATLQSNGIATPFSMNVSQDAKASDKYAVYGSQSGLGMPDRDYYLKEDDAKIKMVRAKYLKHIETMLAMSGDKNAAAHAADVLDLETELAKAQWSRVENRDPTKTYNRVEFAKLGELAPGFDWNAYLKAAGYAGKTDYLIVRQPSYFTAMANIVTEMPLEIWKSYLSWRVIEASASLLNKAAVDERFAFASTTLNGVPQQEPLWQRAVRAVDLALGEAVGKLYVAKHFPAENKARMQTLVNNLLAAFKDGIDNLAWMSPETKKEAQAKLATFKPFIGYPEKWRDYSALKTMPGDLVGNMRAARSFAVQRGINKLGSPVDRDEWGMTPQTVNAQYSSMRNSITFPAAILQPPFFDANADDAVNYGAIGAVIGHEIGHGFDDSGSQYDGQGNLRNWWSDEDRKNFSTRANQLVAQYNAMSPLPGYNVNGKLTLGENIGDTSGLAVAYQAYKKSLGGKPSAVIDGYTGEQRFYMGFAQIWRSKQRDEAVIVQLKTDPHTPASLRPNAVKNQPGFYEAFDVKPGDKMYLAPDQRVIIW